MEIGKTFKKSVEHGHNDKKHKWLNVHTGVVFLLFFLLGNAVKVKGKHVSHYKHHVVQFYKLQAYKTHGSVQASIRD